MSRAWKFAVIAGLLGATGWLAVAQYMTARDEQTHSTEVPLWENDARFKKDTFTFVRIAYSSEGSREGGRRRRGGGWRTDFPDSDLNLSYRLQQMTSLKVNPDGLVLSLSDPKLFDYPFIYIVEPGGLSLSEPEVESLRSYLLNGGFLLCDDFWGEQEWENLAYELRKVFPDREVIDLPRSHTIFHCVFDIKPDQNLQVPSINQAYYGRSEGITWEREDAQEVHFRAILDDKQRIMVMICHNTDFGDGWEREGEDEWYFREFSEKKAYPMGINIVFYALTH